jgi:predicted DsbA family dithiol-disulfide isomerase
MLSRTPGIPVSLFFDYNCPYCYVASSRLQRLQERHNLDVLWRFIETRPGIPASGESAAPEQAAPDARLQALIEEDGLPWQPRHFLANTRRAILFAQAAVLQRPHAFPALHQRLFQASFAEGRNIGDMQELRQIARNLDMEDILHTAWETPAAVRVVLSHVEEAQRRGLTDVPTVVVAERAFPGVVSVDLLEQALQKHAEG